MPSQLQVILDDNATDILYGGGEWTTSTLVQWYKGTSNYLANARNGTFGSLTLSFLGTSVAFIGNTPDFTHSQFATVSINGGTAYNITYPSGVSYIQWFQSPVLPDGQHTIIIDHLDSTAIDIAIITVGPTTSLANRIVFIDNNDPAIEYTGDWTENDSRFDGGTLPSGFPVGNTTQRSATVGDTMAFRFSGTSISVYGIFSWTNIGSVSVAYTLDGVVELIPYLVTDNSFEHIRGDGEATNFLFFDKDPILAGDHTLIMNITDILNQTFIFDYLVYSPSFSSLATMPNLTSGSPVVGPMNPTMPFISSMSNASPNSNSSTSAQTGIGESQGGHKANGTLIGAIVGGTIGLICLTVVAILYRGKKSSNRRRAPSARQGLPLSSHNNAYTRILDLSVVRPIFGRSASSREVTPFIIHPTPASFASVSDLKRNRMEQNPSTGSASTSLNLVQLNNHGSDLNAAPTVDIGRLGYISSQSVPPAYEAPSQFFATSAL